MPGYYEAEWDIAKTAFEKDAGEIIADIEKKATATAKKKVAGLKDEKTVKSKLKKPAEKGWFGRKSSGMKPACKALDKASDAKKASEKDKIKAYEDYEKAANKYITVLDGSLTTEPYKHVTPQIRILKKRIWKILDKYKVTQLQNEDEMFDHLLEGQRLVDKEVEDIYGCFTVLHDAYMKRGIRQRAFNEGDCEALNPLFDKVITKTLKQLTDLETLAAKWKIEHDTCDGLKKFLKSRAMKSFNDNDRKWDPKSPPSYGNDVNAWFDDLAPELGRFKRAFKTKKLPS